MSRTRIPRKMVFDIPDDILIRVCQKHMQGQVFRAPNPTPKFQQIDVCIQDKSWNFVRMDSDGRPVPETSIGDGVGLSHHEKVWRDRRMDNRKSPDERCQPKHPADLEDVDDSPTGDEQRRTVRPRISQHSAPEPTRARDRSAQSRV